MRIKLASLWATFVAACLLSPASWAASYFVDSVAGSDSNSGLSDTAPWKTIAKVNGTAAPFGSTVYLKRGSVWREQLTIPSNGLTIDAYGTGALPTFDSSVQVSGWQSEGSGIYSQVVALAAPGIGGLGNITQNGVFMTHTPWTGSAAGSLNSAPLGSFTFNYSTSRIYIKPTTAPSGNVYLASTLQAGVRAESKSDILVQNINVRRSSLHGIVYNNCNRCSARSSTISDGGGGPSLVTVIPYLYAGNGVEYSGVSDGGVVDGLTITNMFDGGFSLQTYVRNSRLSNITVQNTTIERCGYAGIEMSALPSGSPSTLSNIIVSNVTIRDSGRGWSGNRYGSNGHGILIQSPGGTMSGVQVQAATIITSIGDGIRLSGEVGVVTLNRLIVAGNNFGINASNYSGSAYNFKLLLSDGLIFSNRSYGLIYNSASSLGFNVFHNTFYDNAAINFAIYGQNGQAYIKNNIFASTSPLFQLYVDGYDALRGPSINNNCYVSGTNMIVYRRLGYATVQPFTAATGFESGGAAAANLLFNNPAAYDFGLQAASPCVGRGATNTGIASDLFGRAYKTPPSSGALERP